MDSATQRLIVKISLENIRLKANNRTLCKELDGFTCPRSQWDYDFTTGISGFLYSTGGLINFPQIYSTSGMFFGT